MYFSDPVIFEIPVRPRVQKFVRAKLRDDKGQSHPLLVSAFGEGVSLYLWLIAQSRKVRMVSGFSRKKDSPLYKDKAGRILAPEYMTARLGMGIQELHATRHQYLLNYQELEQFDNYVDFIIQNELVAFCQAQPSVDPLLRIKQFCDLYDFSPGDKEAGVPADYEESALRSVYYRARKGEGTFNFNTNSVLKVKHFQPVLYAA